MTKKIDVINGLRGFAILAVIYHHLPGQYYKTSFFLTSSDIYIFPYTYLSNGWLGVNLFFMLSGFVLFLPYAEGRRDFSSSRDLWRFYRHRAARLLPLYYISLFFIIFILLRATSDPGFSRNFLLMLTMTFNYTRDMWHPIYNAILWSVGLEVWFSILFPFLIFAIKRVGIVRLLIIILAMSLAVRFFGVIYPFFELTHPSPRFNAMKDSLPGRLDDFFLGMLIAFFYVTHLRERPLRAPKLWFFAGLAVLFVACTLWDYYLSGLITSTYLPLFNNIIQLGFALLIISLLSLESGILMSIFINRPIQVIGMMCYSLYIWHYVAIRGIMGSEFSLRGLVFFLIATIVVSLLTYRFVEFRGVKLRKLLLLG